MLSSALRLPYIPSSSFGPLVNCFILKKMLQKVGAKKQPSFTPIANRQGCDISPAIVYWPNCISCSVNTILFLALSIVLTVDENHHRLDYVGSEATLALVDSFISNGWQEQVEQDSRKYFLSDGDYGDSAEIVAVILFSCRNSITVSFLFHQLHYSCINSS